MLVKLGLTFLNALFWSLNSHYTTFTYSVTPKKKKKEDLKVNRLLQRLN